MIGLLLFFGLVFFDLITKALVDCYSLHVTIIPGVFRLSISYNRGMAFSMLADKEWAQAFFLILTAVALVVMLVLYLKVLKGKTFPRIALIFVMAGAVGNFIDRLAYGYVRDFLDIPFFANCNFADAFITAGVIMLFIYLLFLSEEALFPVRKKKDE